MSLAQSDHRAAASRTRAAHVGGYDWQLAELRRPHRAELRRPRRDDRRARATDGSLTVLAPERRTFPVAAHHHHGGRRSSTNGLRDLYAVLGEERDGGAVLRLHVQSAGAVDLVRRADHGDRRQAVAGRPAAARRRAGAPARRRRAGMTRRDRPRRESARSAACCCSARSPPWSRPAAASTSMLERA